MSQKCRRKCSLRSRREWVPARTLVSNASAKSRAGREKNGEESSWNFPRRSQNLAAAKSFARQIFVCGGLGISPDFFIFISVKVIMKVLNLTIYSKNNHNLYFRKTNYYFYLISFAGFTPSHRDQ